MQSKLESAVESGLNVGSGFVISWVATIHILPLWGFTTDIKTAFEITCFYTAISVVRSFAWRRLFVWRTTRKLNKMFAKGYKLSKTDDDIISKMISSQ